MRTSTPPPGGEYPQKSFASTSSPQSHILGMFEYGSIREKLGSVLKDDSNYSIRSTIPHYFANSTTKGLWEEKKATGKKIMADCQSFFPNPFHAYKVFEEGNPEPILVFNSSTPQKVANIISQQN